MNEQTQLDQKQTTKLTPRQQILRDAERVVSKDRNSQYGNPEDNFQNIADLWNAYLKGKPVRLGGQISPFDVAIMHGLMKIARLKHNPNHQDSLLDLVGYGACAADIQARNIAQSSAESHALQNQSAVWINKELEGRN